MNISLEILLSVAFALIASLFIVLLVMLLKIKKSVSNIPHIKINDDLSSRITTLETLATSQKQINTLTIERIDSMVPVLSTISRHATVRYNPFRDAGVGGKQSFSSAMLDKKGSGIILTNLYSREMSRVSIKEIENWLSVEQELSVEEKTVLEQIKNS